MTEITEKQKAFLIKRNAYQEGMTKEDAHKLIGELMGSPIPEKTVAVENNGGVFMQHQESLFPSYSPKDASIISQTCLKVWAEMGGEVPIQDIVGMYKTAYKELIQ